MMYEKFIKSLNKIEIEHIENYLQSQIYELTTEEMRLYIKAFFVLFYTKQQLLMFKEDGTDRRIVEINYDKRTFKTKIIPSHTHNPQSLETPEE